MEGLKIGGYIEDGRLIIQESKKTFCSFTNNHCLLIML